MFSLEAYSKEDIDFFISLSLEQISDLKPKDAEEVLNVLQEYEYLRSEQSLYEYFKSSWHCSDPAKLKDNWHYQCLAEHLEAVSRKEIRRLAITVPPRSGKSKLVSIAYPTWEWGPNRNPSTKFLTVSHTNKLALDLSVGARNIIRHLWYSRWYGEGEYQFKFQDDSNTKSRIDNNAGGYRIAVTPGMDIIGLGYDIAQIDDGLDGSDAENKEAKLSLNSWYSDVLINRANDPQTDRIIIIQQRLAEDDLVGYVKSLDLGYFELKLPNEYVKSTTFISPIGSNDLRTQDGELLMPSRFDEQFILDQKKKPLKYATLYQQEPSPPDGTLVLRSQLQIGGTNETDASKQDYLVITADLTFGKSKNTDDMSCINIYGKKGNVVSLIDELRGDWGITAQLAALEAVYDTYRNYMNLRGIYVEEKANGTASLELLKFKIPVLKGFKPSVFGFSADKIDRLNASRYVLEESRFRRPDENIYGKEWVISWCDELCGFPRWKCDDRVDCYTMAVKILEALPTLTGDVTESYIFPDSMDNSNTHIRDMFGTMLSTQTARNSVRSYF